MIRPSPLFSCNSVGLIRHQWCYHRSTAAGASDELPYSFIQSFSQQSIYPSSHQFVMLLLLLLPLSLPIAAKCTQNGISWRCLYKFSAEMRRRRRRSRKLISKIACIALQIAKEDGEINIFRAKGDE